MFVSTFANVSSDRCVVDVDVTVNIKHGCTRDLIIELLGPSHRHQGVNHRESQQRQHERGQFETDQRVRKIPLKPGINAHSCSMVLMEQLQGVVSTLKTCGSMIGQIVPSMHAVPALSKDPLGQYHNLTFIMICRFVENGLYAFMIRILILSTALL